MRDPRRLRWEERHLTSTPGPPSTFVCDTLDLLQRRAHARTRGRALDLACGSGRHALLLARRGYRVVAVDYARSAAAALAARARAAALALDVLVADVTTWPLPAAGFELVVVTDFLERRLMPALRAAVAPGGVLIMETFLAGQQRPICHPRDPEFLLGPGELRAICGDWTVLAAYEGDRGGRTQAFRAGIAAARPVAR